MNNPTHFRIHYLLKGEAKSFNLHSEGMTDSQAWHMAAVDAGFADIPKYRCDRIPQVTKPKAEMYGITQVEWHPA